MQVVPRYLEPGGIIKRDIASWGVWLRGSREALSCLVSISKACSWLRPLLSLRIEEAL